MRIAVSSPVALPTLHQIIYPVHQQTDCTNTSLHQTCLKVCAINQTHNRTRTTCQCWEGCSQSVKTVSQLKQIESDTPFCDSCHAS
eukprot:m.365744 g.365744  ORF g.365744 m.365744 type:complete len:86 (-) comp32906_c0_seq1:926-1183(-)